MDESTEEERLGFVRSYGVEPVTDINTDLTFKDAATAVAEMTPIIGDAIAAKEVYDELMKDEPNYGLIAALGGAALVGAIPGIGDAAAAGIRKAVDVAKRVEVDPDAVGMMGGNIRIKPKAEQGTPTVEAAGLTDEAIDKWRKENATPEDFRKSLKGRNEELQEAAAGVEEGRVFTSTYRKLADDLRPIRKVNEVPKPATFVEAVSALNAGKRKKPMIGLNASIPDGDEVTARLDIDAYTDYDVWVPTLTHPELKTVYKPSVILEDVTFIKPEGREPKKALGVAKGGAKAPFAVMTGKYVEASDDEAFKLAKDVFDNDDITQVGYDPTRRGFFYDRETGEAVVQADTVIQVGHLVLARNAKKMDAEAFPFNEGGIAMEKQMEMNFGEVPDNTVGVDPVSGNDIPMGATAANVRDDVPAFLSEGEIVVPADVVNFHGVKLFEDLRAEAKMGYAQMAEDGRIGGEPMDINDDMGMDIELSELDLEIMDDEAPVEMRRGGMSMKDYEGVTKNRDIKPPKRSGPRKTHAEIMASAFRDDDSSSSSSSSKPSDYYSPENISKRVQARKDKPKTRGQALYESLREYFDFDREYENRNRRVKLTQKPPTSDNIGPSISEQINFGGKGYDFRDNNSPTPPPPKVRQSTTGARGTPDDDETFSVRYADQPFYTRLLQNLRKDLGFDEGGLVPDEDQHLIGGESQFNQGPYYAPDQKGGFDMENAYANYGGDTGGPVLEMREYMNDDGHRIFITFIDGEPQMEIPAGYYPVGDSEVVAPTTPTPPVGGSGGSDMGDSGSGTDMPTPEAVNFKELSMEELTQLIEDQKSLSSKIVKNINPLVRLAMWDQTRRTKAEIERRLADPNTSNVDKMRLRQLLELANRDEPGLIKSLLDKVTGNTLQTAAGQIPKPKVPDVDFDDPTEAGTVAEAYTPNEQEESDTTTPGVPSYDPIPPARSGFGGMGIDPAEEFGGSQTRFQQPTVVPEERRVSTPDPTPVNEMSPRVKAARQNTQKVLKDMRDRGASREDRTASMAAGARTEQVLRDLDRGVVRGFKEGGLVDKPKVKKVVKGLKKASKSHAKQAATLEDALKASKKKKSK